MKTNYTNLILALVFIAFGSPSLLQAQGLLSIGGFDDDYDEDIGWANATIGGSAGFGWSDNDSFSQTTFCLGGEYLHRIAGEAKNPVGAGYLGAFANYHYSDSDNFKENLFRVGLKFSYFDRITALNEVQLIYGVKSWYETGSRDFTNVEDDVTGFGVSGYTGLNVRVCEGFSIGAELPILSYVSRTFENNGNEFKADNTSIALNKDNPVMAYARWHLGRTRAE